MRRLQFALAALALASIGWMVLKHPSADRFAATKPGGPSGSQNASAVLRERVSGSVASPEVAELKAELKQKDQMIAALMMQAAKQSALSPEQTPRTMAQKTIERLDKVLVAGDLDGPEVHHLTALLERATATLPPTVSSSVACSTELCRVTVDGNEEVLDREVGAVQEQLQQPFSGAIVYKSQNGHRVLYAAKRQETLSVW